MTSVAAGTIAPLLKQRDFLAWLEAVGALSNYWLHVLLPAAEENRVCAAMRYSSLGGGKRLRPALVYACGELYDIPERWLHNMATSVEVTHAFSLIHDDLPALDDDALRHNIPSCHLQFDEATAILAGDAMLALSFDILYRLSEEATRDDGEQNATPMPNAICLKVGHELSRASGPYGMIAGQLMDLAFETRKQIPLDDVRRMHRLKTGQLFSACLCMVYLAQGGQKATAQYRQLHEYALAFGLVFQIQDDILDVIGDQSRMGKPTRSDLKSDKCTYVSLLGIAGAKVARDQAHAEAAALLDGIEGNTARLRQILDFARARDH